MSEECPRCNAVLTNEAIKMGLIKSHNHGGMPCECYVCNGLGYVGKAIKAYSETHYRGIITQESKLENANGSYEIGDIGISIGSDGRIWICVNGRSLIRARPSDFYDKKKVRDYNPKVMVE